MMRRNYGGVEPGAIFRFLPATAAAASGCGFFARGRRRQSVLGSREPHGNAVPGFANAAPLTEDESDDDETDLMDFDMM